MNRIYTAVAAFAALLVVCLLGCHVPETVLADAPPRILGPYSDAFNFPADFAGTPDSRPSTWGLAGSQSATVPFHPPAGYRVRVLKLDGNYMAWTRGLYPPGNHVGSSWGILTTAPSGSMRVDYAADNCFAWLEYGLSNGEVNQPFSIDSGVGGLLGPDNSMVVVLAVYLNDQPISVHQEVTFIATFQFERIQQ